jgi:3-hydroxybutyryl-CoA dehydratase
MKVGDSTQVSRTFSSQNLKQYRALSGHEVSSDQVPEPLIGALFSYLLGVKLPGLGTNYLKQETRFEAETKVGEALLAQVEITRLRPDKHIVDLATTCHHADGTLIASGRALVYVGELVRKTSLEH